MDAPTADISVERATGATVLRLAGRLDAAGAGLVWERALDAAQAADAGELVLDLAAVTLVDTAGAALLLAAEAAHGGTARVDGAAEHMRALLGRVRAATPKPPAPASAAPLRPQEVLAAGLRAAGDGVAFLGEVALSVVRLPRNLRVLRGGDMLRTIDQAGVRALPLVIMLGFLIGLILSFQSAVPMRRFGADIFVANLVSISLLRELGPLLAAVILSGRTGSAFAAEIGTMKVNEEVDALATMGLDPVTMLVLPRLVAATLVMPALTLVLSVAGLCGMAVVMGAFGFPLVTVTRQVAGAVTLTDLFQGLFKAVCFGAVIGAIGCRQGLDTGVGPRAVGLAATGAVVGGIVATIMFDGVFALILYKLNL
jgi:phospholipid/cholesterol/gamma-HCH transport system permease protein